jgi:hypothetical protein
MSNFHFDISLKLSQGEVHDVSEEVQKAKGRCKTISGEVRTSHTSPQNPAMYNSFTMYNHVQSFLTKLIY